MRPAPSRTVRPAEGQLVDLPVGSVGSGVRGEAPNAWCQSAAVLGGGLVVLGVLVDRGVGTTTAIAGVSLFFATAVLAGFERYEWATAVGFSAIVWTAAGIAISLGTDRYPLGAAAGLGFAGAGLVVLGVVRARRRRVARHHPRNGPPRAETA